MKGWLYAALFRYLPTDPDIHRRGPAGGATLDCLAFFAGQFSLKPLPILSIALIASLIFATKLVLGLWNVEGFSAFFCILIWGLVTVVGAIVSFISFFVANDNSFSVKQKIVQSGDNPISIVGDVKGSHIGHTTK